MRAAHKLASNQAALNTWTGPSIELSCPARPNATRPSELAELTALASKHQASNPNSNAGLTTLARLPLMDEGSERALGADPSWA